MFSSVELSEPNNKFSTEIAVYGIIFINNCILINNEYHLLKDIVGAAGVIDYNCSK